MNSTLRTAVFGAVVAAAGLCWPVQASARGFVGLGVAFPIGGSPSYYIPGHYETRVEQVLVTPGRTETRTEKVLVAPAHYEDRVTPAIERTVYDKYGWPQTVLVQPARTERVFVPEKFEMRTTQVAIPPVYTTRTVQVYVPGYWAGAPAPAVVGVGVGGAFRW